MKELNYLDITKTGQGHIKVPSATGIHPDMGVGTAQAIQTNIHESDSVPYLFRPTPYNSTRESGDIVGASVPWNQMLDPAREESAGSSVSVTITRDGHGAITLNGTANANGSYVLYPSMPLVIGHKYLMGGYVKVGSNTGYLGLAGIKVDDGSCGIYSNTTYNALNARIDLKQGDSFSNVTMKPYCVDLTLALDSAIADYIYGLESGTAGAGIAKLREWGFFDKPYYAYNAGGIESVNVSKHRMTGLNQWDEEWANGYFDTTTGAFVESANTNIAPKNYIPVISGATYCIKQPTSNDSQIYQYDANKNYISRITGVYHGVGTFTVAANCAYIKFCVFTYGQGFYNHDICVNISNPAVNGQYEPYTVNEYPLDYSLTLRGILKLDGSNNLYADGDVYEADGTVTRKYGVVDLGTLNWVNYKTGGFNANLDPIPIQAVTGRLNFRTSKYYEPKPASATLTSGMMTLTSGRIYIVDNAFTTDAAAFKTAMSGIYLVYELATPTTETADPYTEVQVCSPYGTEEFEDHAYLLGYRDVKIPVGHNTSYAKNIVGAIEGIPLPPSANGTYTLKVTVASGVPTYSWVSE